MATKVISNFKIDTSNIKSAGQTRAFQVIGSKNAVFSMEVTNEDGHYYNFYTKTFSATKATLSKIALRNGVYSGSITFPKVTDDDHYDILLYAEPSYDTKHTLYIESRDANGNVDVNASVGSDSLMLVKKIFQFLDVTLTLTAISVNSLTGFSSSSVSNTTIDLTRGQAGGKVPFTIVYTANAARNVSIDRQPSEIDIATFVQRTIGSAAIPIQGEDTDSDSLFYKWPIDNIVGLRKGMMVTRATNVTNGTIIKDYFTELEIEYRPEDQQTARQQRELIRETEMQRSAYNSVSRLTPIDYNIEKPLEDFIPGERETKTYYEVYEPALQPTGEATLTDGIVTSQAGNIVFSHQQADALKDDTIKILGYGMQNIKSLSNYELKFTDLKVELTPVTTTTTSAVSNNTSVPVASRNGIRDGNVSTVTGIGIDTSSAIPTVDSGAGAVSGAGTIVLSAAQTLEDGITLSFGKTSRVATITGNVEVVKAGLADATIRFDLEKFLTAV